MSSTQDDKDNLGDVKDSKDEVVDKKAYLRVSKDMHEYKDQLKATKAELDRIKADIEAQQTQKMVEEKKWADLYKKSETVIQAKDKELQETKNKFANFHKLNSVLQEVGGFKKNEYNRFVNLEAIQLNADGSVDEATVKAEADRVRREYSELLKTIDVREPRSAAPQSGAAATTDVSKMTRQELEAYRASVIAEMDKQNKN